MLEWLNGLVGLGGVVLGIVITEYFRRRQRAEHFAGQVFARRLEAYEGLWSVLQEAAIVADRVIGEDDLSSEDRAALIGKVLDDVGTYVDRNSLYIEDEVRLQSCIIFVGLEDISDLPEKEKEDRIELYRRQWRSTVELVKEYSGMAQIHRTFGSINKPKHKSPIVEYYRQQRKARLKDDRRG